MTATDRYDGKLSPSSLPMFTLFILIHLGCLGLIWTGAGLTEWLVCFGLFFLRIFGITAGYHRYFAHRAYKTSRVFQFILGFIAQSSLQSGLIWWASKHRDHHKFVDTPKDSHSPREYGFWFSHLGWIFNDRAATPNLENVPDITRYPELVWLDRYHWVPGTLLGFSLWAWGGWSMLVVGFCLSTVITWHSTFFINSLAHVYGSQRYLTGDDSRNNFWLALLTLGEGWHNNHHYYMSSVRQGFFWYEIDITYYLLKMLSWFGIVWDLKEPPAHVRAGERKISAEVIDRVAAQLAGSFSVDHISAAVRERWEHSEVVRAWGEFRHKAEEQLAHSREAMAEWHLPELPSLEEMQARAHKMFARSPSLDDVVLRARQMLAEAVTVRLPQPMPA